MLESVAVPEWVPTFDNIQYNSAVTGLNKVVFRLIDERRHQLASSSAPQKKDLLTRLLQVLFSGSVPESFRLASAFHLEFS